MQMKEIRKPTNTTTVPTIMTTIAMLFGSFSTATKNSKTLVYILRLTTLNIFKHLMKVIENLIDIGYIQDVPLCSQILVVSQPSLKHKFITTQKNENTENIPLLTDTSSVP